MIVFHYDLHAVKYVALWASCARERQSGRHIPPGKAPLSSPIYATKQTANCCHFVFVVLKHRFGG